MICPDSPANSLDAGISGTHTATPSPSGKLPTRQSLHVIRDYTDINFYTFAGEDFYINMNDSYDYLLKLLIMGDANSNKEIFVNKFIGNTSAIGTPTAGSTYGTVHSLAILVFSTCSVQKDWTLD